MSKGKSRASIATVAESCLASRLRRLNRVVSGFYDDALRPLGLKVSQFNILIQTAKLGVARPAIMCELLDLEASTLSRNVERLRARGWVEIVPAADARAQPFRLTPRGRALIDKALPAWAKAQRRAGQLLGERAIGLLDKAAASLREPSPR
jgi:DNA-binding MarR family transcriptional regulator